MQMAIEKEDGHDAMSSRLHSSSLIRATSEHKCVHSLQSMHTMKQTEDVMCDARYHSVCFGMAGTALRAENAAHLRSSCLQAKLIVIVVICVVDNFLGNFFQGLL